MSTVIVKNIGAKTEDKDIRAFFSFCGKISSLDVTTEGETKSATVTFEKETAARTALLLDHTKLGEHELSVTSESGEHADSGDDVHPKSDADRDTDEITQEEKPRSRVFAELLANGYLVADSGLKTAIALDEKHGVSQRFLSTIQSLDQKYHATDRAKTADQSYGITARANSLFSGLSSYFEKALEAPGAKKIVDFYTTSAKQVQDIHNEAKRLAELKKNEAGGSSYKAAGLDKVFGAEKAPGQEGKPNDQVPGGAPSDAAATESNQQPIAQGAYPGTAEKIPQ